MAIPKPSDQDRSRRAWREARELLAQHRRSLARGPRADAGQPPGRAGAAGEHQVPHRRRHRQAQHHLLMPLALAAGLATLVQAVASYANCPGGERGRPAGHHGHAPAGPGPILRLPIRYFDSTKSGVVIARVMNDAEGIRNLVGTGLIQLAGGVLTAIMALAVLFWLNWKLTLAILVFLAPSAWPWPWPSTGCAPCSAGAASITADITGRLAEAVAGPHPQGLRGRGPGIGDLRAEGADGCSATSPAPSPAPAPSPPSPPPSWGPSACSSWSWAAGPSSPAP